MKYAMFVIAMPFYAVAWIISHALRLRDRDNMPTPAELFLDLSC